MSSSSSAATPKVRISLACVACKKRKAKCSGGPPPCQACKASGTGCVIDESLDGRRKAAAKRTYDELTYHKTFIKGLLAYIRTYDHESLDQLVQLIKADVPLTKIGALVDESLRLSEQGVQAEEHMRILDLDNTSFRNIRRRTDPSATESPYTPSASEFIHGPKGSLENQAQAIDDQEVLFHFLKNALPSEIGDIGQYVQGGAPNLYDGLLQYAMDNDRRGYIEQAADAGMPRRAFSLIGLAGTEFSKARTMSLPNLFQYQQYIQGLFNEYTSTELRAEAIPDSRERQGWHPSLRLRFSSSSAGSDDSSEKNQPETQEEYDSQEGAFMESESEPDVKGKAKARPREPGLAQRRRQNPDNFRLRRDNDPLMGEEFQLPLQMSQSTTEQEPSLPSPVANTFGIMSEHRLHNLNLPLYQLLPLTGIDDSPLARSYTSYRDEARAMIANGVPIQHIFGGSRIEVALLFRPRTVNDPHSVCHWASEMCAAFRRDIDMTWLMACAMALARLMKWLLIPTEESYKRIPVTMRPTQTQRFVPHNPVADLIPIPCIRDALCIRFRDCVQPFINNCHFEWPYGVEAAVEHDAESGSYKLTSEFEKAVNDPTKFKINPAITDFFPEALNRADVYFVERNFGDFSGDGMDIIPRGTKTFYEAC